MLARLCRRLWKSRRASVAIVVAVTLVPMMIAGAVGIDMARIAEARTVLQAAVDSAAIAGGGAYGTSNSASAAATAAQAAYAGNTASLSGMVASITPSSASSLVSTYCNSGGSVSCSGVGSDTSGSCPAGGYQYCVVVQASLSLNNILAAYILPRSYLSVKAVDTVGTPTYDVNPGDVSSSSVGSAYDHNILGAYVVGSEAAGAGSSAAGAADFAAIPDENSSCGGVFPDETNITQVPSSTPCNFLFIGSSTGGSASGTLSLTSGQYVAFAFFNLTGGTTPFGADTGTNYYTNITVSTSQNGSGTLYPNGACYTGSSLATGSDCTRQHPSLYGECPVHNLYGSISQGTIGALVANGATDADSLTVYSSAYEMLGYPPTHDVNHSLPSFTSEISESFGSGGYGAPPQTYYVTVTCPNWPTTEAAAAADGVSSQVPVDTNITDYATYYPDVTLTGGTGTYYPPSLQSACSPAASYPAASGTSTDSWWGWSADNTKNTASNGTPYCANQPQLSGTSTYDPSYNNCALIIQPLGSGVPASSSGPELPSYYIAVKDSSGTLVLLDPVYDNATYTDLYPGVEDNLPAYDSSMKLTASSAAANNGSGLAVTLTSSHNSSYYPTRTKYYAITSGAYSGDTAYIEKPAQNSAGGYIDSLPPETSHRCYNPQKNGFSSDAFYNTNNDNGSAVDHVANPQLGAIDCAANIGRSFGLYWNDMGGAASDDLGYWNAVTVFTCPSPTYTTGSSAPSTLSG